MSVTNRQSSYGPPPGQGAPFTSKSPGVLGVHHASSPSTTSDTCYFIGFSQASGVLSYIHGDIWWNLVNSP